VVTVTLGGAGKDDVLLRRVDGMDGEATVTGDRLRSGGVSLEWDVAREDADPMDDAEFRDDAAVVALEGDNSDNEDEDDRDEAADPMGIGALAYTLDPRGTGSVGNAAVLRCWAARNARFSCSSAKR